MSKQIENQFFARDLDKNTSFILNTTFGFFFEFFVGLTLRAKANLSG